MTELEECKGDKSIQSPLEKESIKIEKFLSKWQANIRKLYFFQFLIGFHMIAGVLLPFFLTWGNLTFVEVMFLQSYFTIMVLVFEIPCGALADRVSRKFSLFLGATSGILAVLIYSSLPNIIIFTIGETFFAFTTALISGTDQAILYDTMRKMDKEQEISKIIARSRGFLLLGITVSAPIGSIIGVYLSLEYSMSLMFIPFMIAAFISLTLKEPNHNLTKEKTENYLKIIRSGFKELKNNKTLKILSIDMILTESIVFFLIWTYQIYLEELEFQLIYFGFISAALTMTEIVFTNLVPKLEKKQKNKKRFLQIYTVIPGIGFIFMALVHFTPISIALILIIIGFGFSRSIIFVSGINKQIETKSRATVLSTVNMMGSFIRAIIYPFIGFFVMWNLNITFIILGIIIIIFALLTRVKNEYF